MPSDDIDSTGSLSWRTAIQGGEGGEPGVRDKVSDNHSIIRSGRDRLPIRRVGGLAVHGGGPTLKLTAGKQTIVNFVYGAALDLKLHMVVPWAAAALFGGLWQWERRLRKKTVAREHDRVVELEKRLDPGRTSSGLTPMGDDPGSGP